MQTAKTIPGQCLSTRLSADCHVLRGPAELGSQLWSDNPRPRRREPSLVEAGTGIPESGTSTLELAYASQEVRRGPSDRCSPAHQVGPRAEQDDHARRPGGAQLEATVNPQATSIAVDQCSRWSRQTGFSSGPNSIRFFLTRRVGGPVADQGPNIEIRLRRGRISNLNRPDGSSDAEQILRVGYLLVAHEFGPCPIGRVGEVVRRAFALSIPAAL